MHRVPLVIALAAGLMLAGCATRPKSPGQPLAAAAADAPETQAKTTVPARTAALSGLQEDFAAAAGDRVFFAVDRFDLTSEAAETLQRQAVWLNRRPGAKVMISGNADERGTREYNLALGARRAEAARRQLIANGVASTRIQTVSYGKEKPLDPNFGENAWSRNRNAGTLLMIAPGRSD